MKRNTAETRRRLLAFLGAFPVSFCSVPSKAEPKQLELSSYFHGETLSVNGAQLFADKATEDSAGTIRVSLEAVPPWVPFQMMSKASALAHYCAPDVADIEPIFGLVSTAYADRDIRRGRNPPSNRETLLQLCSRPTWPDLACDTALAAGCAMEHVSHSVSCRPPGQSIPYFIICRRTGRMGKNLRPIRCAAGFSVRGGVRAI